MAISMATFSFGAHRAWHVSGVVACTMASNTGVAGEPG